MAEEITIEPEDLTEGSVEESVVQDRSLEDMARASRSTIATPLMRSPFFYYTFAGFAGALLATTAVFFIRTNLEGLTQVKLLQVPIIPPLTYICASAAIGLAMGLSYGLIYRNLRKALSCGLTGLVLAGATAFFLAGIGELFSAIALDIPKNLLGAASAVSGEGPDRGLLMFLHISTSGFTWAMVGLAALLGPGVAMRSGALCFQGVAAGAIGGFIGGISIPVFERFGPALLNLSPLICGLASFAVIGLAMGMMMAVMEFGTREAWFILAKGPLRGKRFVLFRDSILVGSTMRCDLYLFNDPAIAPVHASLSREGIRWLLRDEGSPQGTFVNGHRIQQCLLNHDDVVTMGETVLKFKLNKRTNQVP